MDIEKIVDYSFEKKEKSNVLAIHPTRPLIAYLINIQRTPKISKAWSSSQNDSPKLKSSSSKGNDSLIDEDNRKTVSIRIIDYVTRQRCLAKGIYHAKPADCVFTINSLLCSQSDIFKLAIVDRLANIYLYDLSYFLNDLTATRVAVIRGPDQNPTPFDYISLVWCPFVPCEDFDDGDGGLRLALATNSRIEIFAIDRLQGKIGELQRSDLKGAYKCINDAHRTDITSLSISPDCSTISVAALDNRVTFFSSDIDDGGQRCLHNWEASSITDKSSISKLFFLDNYPKLLEDSTMKFWGSAFIGTQSGQMLLIDLRTWTVYQKMNIPVESDNPSHTRNFNYRIDITSKNIVAISGNQCYIVQIEHDTGKHEIIDANGITNCKVYNYSELISKNSGTPGKKLSSSSKKQTSSTASDGLPRISNITKLNLYNTIYSFVVKHKSENELELFTISAYSLERCTINLKALTLKERATQQLEEAPSSSITASFADEAKTNANTPNELKRFLQQFDGSLKISSSGSTPPVVAAYQQQNQSIAQPLILSSAPSSIPPMSITQANVPAVAATINALNTSAQSMNTSMMNNAAAHFMNNSGNVMMMPSKPSIGISDSQMNPQTNANLAQANFVDVNQMDRMVEALFTKLNTAFGQGLNEFLNDVKSEVSDLKLKLNNLSRDVRKLQQQLQETTIVSRQK